jgi:hypothetical protein
MCVEWELCVRDGLEGNVRRFDCFMREPWKLSGRPSGSKPEPEIESSILTTYFPTCVRLNFAAVLELTTGCYFLCIFRMNRQNYGTTGMVIDGRA